MTGYMGGRVGWRAEIATLRADLAAIRAALDCPPVDEVTAELARPSVLGMSSCLEYKQRAIADSPIRKGWYVRMVVNECSMRFRVASDVYAIDDETVVDLVGAASGVKLCGVPVSALDIRRWAAESQSCGHSLTQPHKAAHR